MYRIVSINLAVRFKHLSSSSLARVSPLLDIGLFFALPRRSLLDRLDPVPPCMALDVISPSELRSANLSLGLFGSPLHQRFDPLVVVPCHMTSPLPFGPRYSFHHVCDSCSSPDFLVTDSVPQADPQLIALSMALWQTRRRLAPFTVRVIVSRPYIATGRMQVS